MNATIGLCLGCGYSLYGLSENRCPECGRGFDPNDPWTMNLGRVYPKWVGLLLWAPNRIFHAVVVVLTVLTLLAFTGPGVYIGPALFLLMGWLATGAFWFARLVTNLWAADLYNQARFKWVATWRRWLLAPLLVAFTGVCLVLQLPLFFAFNVSRTFLNDVVASALRTSQPIPQREWAGLYPINEINRLGSDVRVTVSHAGMGAGFYFSSSGRPADTGETSYRALGGGWYAWEDHF